MSYCAAPPNSILWTQSQCFRIPICMTISGLNYKIVSAHIYIFFPHLKRFVFHPVAAVADGPSLGIWQIELSKEKAHSLQCSLDCYTNALKCDQGQSPTFLVNVARKIGNAKNELGVHIMSKASDCYKQREGKVSKILPFLVFELMNKLFSGRREKLKSNW